MNELSVLKLFQLWNGDFFFVACLHYLQTQLCVKYIVFCFRAYGMRPNLGYITINSFFSFGKAFSFKITTASLEMWLFTPSLQTKIVMCMKIGGIFPIPYFEYKSGCRLLTSTLCFNFNRGGF